VAGQEGIMRFLANTRVTIYTTYIF